ncbi:MAG: hypothetical protein K1X67_01520 [Fimbriimonadaceae bacterium]|nr:hypothetical protein [Fimbriimonadaceae bacterium]
MDKLTKAMVGQPERLLDGIDSFGKELSDEYSNRGWKPSPGSPVEMDCADPTFGSAAETAHSLGMFLSDVASDQLLSFAKLTRPVALTVGPLTCVRSLIEASALSMWILDSSVDVKCRVARGLAYRYDGLVQQGKLNGIDQIKVAARRQVLENEADGFGFPAIVSKGGIRNGAGCHFPNYVDLARGTLRRGEESYRLLSACVHGHFWALKDLGYRVIPRPDDLTGQALEKHQDPTVVVFVGCIAVEAYVGTVLSLWKLFGWEQSTLHQLLEVHYERMGLSPKLYTWR